MDTSASEPGDWFAKGDSLGEYEVDEVMPPGYFSFNLKVKDPTGALGHAVVHHRKELTPNITFAGIILERNFKHKALPTIVHVGRGNKNTRNNAWFVREILPPPLGDNIRQGVLLTAEDTLLVGLGVCELLEYLHDPNQHGGKTYTHGFLRPGYIHRAESGQVKVAAMDVQVLIREGVPVHMRHRVYRSPECLNASPDELDAHNDLWALAGCMLYLATGEPPNYADVQNIAQLQAGHEQNLAQERTRKNISFAPLRDLLIRCFESRPERRFQSAVDLRCAIEAALGHLGPKDEVSTQVRFAIENRFPYPIAKPFYQLRGARDSTGEILLLVDLLGATLSHLAILGVTEYLQGAKCDAQLNESLRKRFDRPISHGTWAGILRDTLKYVREKNVTPFVRELLDCYFAQEGEPSVIALIQQGDELVEMRNRLVHNVGAPSTPHEHREFKRKLIGLLRSVAFLKDYPLVTVQGSRTESGIKNHECMWHMGFHENFDHVDVNCNLDLEASRLSLLCPRDQELLSLHPFYILRECQEPKCGAVHLFSLGHFSSTRADYVAPGGHQFQDAGLALEIAGLLAGQAGPPLRRKANYLYIGARDQRQTFPKKHVIGGKYEIVNFLRRGGMADVYKVKDLEGGGVFALKLLPFQFLSDQAMIQRFRHEATQAERLKHDHIASVISYGEDLADHYLIMELAPGWPLQDGGVALDAGELPLPLELGDAVKIVKQVCDGLDYIHRQQTVHRDVKPANLLLFDERCVKLTDFGIARSRESIRLTLTGQPMGTPEYMAPEQIKGVPEITPAADLYSVGVVLYQLLTGTSPFRRSTPLATEYANVNDTAKPITALNCKIGLEIEDIIKRCLQKRPQDRFQSARQLFESFPQV